MDFTVILEGGSSGGRRTGMAVGGVRDGVMKLLRLYYHSLRTGGSAAGMTGTSAFGNTAETGLPEAIQEEVDLWQRCLGRTNTA
jgi:hypothetical protein